MLGQMLDLRLGESLETSCLFNSGLCGWQRLFKRSGAERGFLHLLALRLGVANWGKYCRFVERSRHPYTLGDPSSFCSKLSCGPVTIPGRAEAGWMGRARCLSQKEQLVQMIWQLTTDPICEPIPTVKRGLLQFPPSARFCWGAGGGRAQVQWASVFPSSLDPSPKSAEREERCYFFARFALPLPSLVPFNLKAYFLMCVTLPFPLLCLCLCFPRCGEFLQGKFLLPIEFYFQKQGVGGSVERAGVAKAGRINAGYEREA